MKPYLLGVELPPEIMMGVAVWRDHHHPQMQLPLVTLPEAVEMAEDAWGVVAVLAPRRRSADLIAKAPWLVNVSGVRAVPQVKTVTVDDAQVAAMAFSALQERRCPSVACLWRRGELYARRRRAAFRQLARRAGVACDDATTDDLGGDAEAWRDWLKALPEGAGLLASSDDVARRCLLALDGVRSIPGSLSVLGVGNSRRMCDTVRPGLSSVIVPWRQIGYRAAEVLDEVRRKRDVSGGLVAVPPAGIAWRQSTGAESVDDPLVRRALAWMTEHAPSGGNVSDLLRTLNVSRRTLETRFRAALQRTPLEQLHLARIEIAKRMLSVADDKIEAIARKSGFHGRDRFGKVFRRLVGLTPAQYREQAREDTVD